MKSKELSKLPKMSDTMMAVGSGERQRFNWRRSLALSLHALREAGLLEHSIMVLIGSFARFAASLAACDADQLVSQTYWVLP